MSQAADKKAADKKETKADKLPKPDPLPRPEDAKTEEEQAPKVVPVSAGRMGLFEEHRRIWQVNVPHGTNPDDCLDEQFWAHVSMLFSPADEIRAMPDDIGWELVLHVVRAGRSFAQVIEKQRFDLAASDNQSQLPSVYAVRWAGTTSKFQVLRNGRLLKDGFATQKIANQYIENHDMAVNRKR